MSDSERFLPAPSVSTSMVVFTAVDGVLREGGTGSCGDARVALELLTTRGVPVILMAHCDAASLQGLQRELGLRQPFIANGGASLYIPRGYFEELDGLSSGDAWEIFEFGVRDPARAVRLLAALYGRGDEEVLTIGFGCDWPDRALLAAVAVPIVVRQEGVDQTRLLRHVPTAYLTTAAGPAGWSEAVLGSTAL